MLGITSQTAVIFIFSPVENSNLDLCIFTPSSSNYLSFFYLSIFSSVMLAAFYLLFGLFFDFLLCMGEVLRVKQASGSEGPGSIPVQSFVPFEVKELAL